MAKRDLSTVFKSLLLRFVGEADPLLSMLEWIAQQLMLVEAETRVGAEKGNTPQSERHISQDIVGEGSILAWEPHTFVCQN